MPARRTAPACAGDDELIDDHRAVYGAAAAIDGTSVETVAHGRDGTTTR